MPTRPRLLSMLVWLSLSAPAAYAASDVPVDVPVKVTRTSTPPVVDGNLSEPLWTNATVISDFKQRLPIEGAPASERTVIYLVYTTQALYVGIRAYHEHTGAVVATTMRRDNMDQLMEDDQFAIAIDSYNDGRNGYWFSTNPLGVRVDGQFFDEGNRWEMNWNGVWQCQAQRHADGWSAELEIPFSTMRFPEAAETVMGINLFRRIIRSNELLYAPLIPLRYEGGTAAVSIATKYLFENISGGRNLKIKPYTLGGLRNDDLRTTARADGEADLGLDVRYGVTDNLTATISLNTDFAQAEADERQINLTRFSLFFPEKRDFFLENAGNFVFGTSEETEIFFSRRIGLSPDATGREAPVPILVGGKATGKLGGVDVGLLNVQTRSSGSTPAENFGVARVKMGVLPRSYVGAIFTNKASGGGVYNRAYGADFSVYVLGDISVAGYAATTTASEPGRRLSNASALHLALLKGGERTAFNVGVTDIGSAFDPAIGFVLRPGTRKWQAALSVPWYAGSSPLQRIVPGFETVYYVGHDGRLQSALHRGEVRVEWQSADQITAFFTRTFEYLFSDFRIFRDVVVSAGRYTDYQGGITLATKPGRKLAGTLNLSGGRLFDGSLFEGEAALVWKLNRHLALSPVYATSAVDLADASFRTHLIRWRATFSLNTRFAVASLVQYDNGSDQLGLNLRLNYQFREGTELFLVFNNILDDPSASAFSPGRARSRAILLKFTYLFDV